MNEPTNEYQWKLQWIYDQYYQCKVALIPIEAKQHFQSIKTVNDTRRLYSVSPADNISFDRWSFSEWYEL